MRDRRRRVTNPTIAPSVPIDTYNSSIRDPTPNVLDLVDAAVRRQDDLRASAQMLNSTRITHQKEMSEVRAAHQKDFGIVRERHVKEISDIREQHQKELAKAEADRLNSIRQVDREEVAKTATSANQAIATLAKTTQDLATSLADRVATTAAAADSRTAAFVADFNKRLSQIELAASASAGKQTVSDPQLERMAGMVEKLVTAQAQGTGKQEGLSLSAAIVMGAIAIISGLLGIAGLLYAGLKP